MRTSILSERIGSNRMLARVSRPVRPSPPIVARKSPSFSSGEQCRRSPEERSSEKPSTKRPKLPSAWWFLPCTSLAIAPPRVAWLVPGETGRNHPAGTIRRRMAASVTPGSAVSRPRSRSKAMK